MEHMSLARINFNTLLMVRFSTLEFVLLLIISLNMSLNE